MKTSSEKYPYQGRNLFDYPENYFYANCNERNSFVYEYKMYREFIIKSIESNKAQVLDIDTHTESEKTDLNYFFDELRHQIQNNNLVVFDKFCAKYEVRKRLYAKYDENYSPIKEFGDADFSSYINFANCLCLAYKKTECLSYLSTLMKCCDALCSISFVYAGNKELIKILRMELQFVNNIR